MREINSVLSPELMKTEAGSLRRIGFEFEFSGLEQSQIAQCVQATLGGTLTDEQHFSCKVQASHLGDFKIELDAAYLQKLDKQESSFPQSIEQFSIETIKKAAEQIVPWELVTSPIEFDSIPYLSPLIDCLRQRGALGTKHSIHFAFGMHLNPELPSTQVECIHAYLKSFLCLRDWILRREGIDISRRITNFIKHFDSDYIAHTINPNYKPSMAAFIDDYLVANPTRNRSLDLLPLLSHIDNQRVKAAVDDPRINARPTLHYRMPNCDIDNPDWNVDFSWESWLAVEKLANAPKQLDECCMRYQKHLARLAHSFDFKWADEIEQLLGLAK